MVTVLAGPCAPCPASPSALPVPSRHRCAPGPLLQDRQLLPSHLTTSLQSRLVGCFPPNFWLDFLRHTQRKSSLLTWSVFSTVFVQAHSSLIPFSLVPHRALADILTGLQLPVRPGGRVPCPFEPETSRSLTSGTGLRKNGNAGETLSRPCFQARAELVHFGARQGQEARVFHPTNSCGTHQVGGPAAPCTCHEPSTFSAAGRRRSSCCLLCFLYPNPTALLE